MQTGASQMELPLQLERAYQKPGSGVKHDYNKPRMDLVLGDFAEAIEQVSRVGTFGASKYSDSGWKYVPNGKSRYRDALLRHYFQDRRGEATDPESQLLHLAHLAWNGLAILQLELMTKANEDKNKG